MLDQRAARQDHFPTPLFQEPAWDMLLALFIAQCDGVAYSGKTLSSFARTPPTTAQRWIDHLHRLKLINRVINTDDRRCSEISLSDSGNRGMEAYLKAMASSASLAAATADAA